MTSHSQTRPGTRSPWKAASRCNNGSCVEVSFDPDSRLVSVRDNKQRGGGPVLSFTAAEWTAFLLAVKQS